MPETIQSLTDKLALYEQNGPAKLYYALVRKMNEMAGMLNKVDLANISIDDGANKSYDRVMRIIEKSETISNSLKAIKSYAKISGNEEEDIAAFADSIAEKRN